MESASALFNGCMNYFDRIFMETAPGYVLVPESKLDNVITKKGKVLETDGINGQQEYLDLTIRDILINLCPSFEDNIFVDGEPFYRGDVDNFMGFRLAIEDTIVDLASNESIEDRVQQLNKISIKNSVKYTDNYTSYSTRFTINGV
jgi:hypothetical protein